MYRRPEHMCPAARAILDDKSLTSCLFVFCFKLLIWKVAMHCGGNDYCGCLLLRSLWAVAAEPWEAIRTTTAHIVCVDHAMHRCAIALSPASNPKPT